MITYSGVDLIKNCLYMVIFLTALIVYIYGLDTWPL